MNRHTRRALLRMAGIGAPLLLAGCSFTFDIRVELPRIKISAGKLTAWIARKFSGWAPALVNSVQAENTKIQAMDPNAGWGPLVREIIKNFVLAVQTILDLASKILPILGVPATVLNIAIQVMRAISAFSGLMGVSGDGPVPTMEDAVRMSDLLAAN